MALSCDTDQVWNDGYRMALSCDTDNVWNGNYRWAFNGVTRDDGIRGAGNSYEFKYRGYDARLGRFTSVDPIAAQYPWNSAYAFAENDVIRSMDLEGREKWIATENFMKGYGSLIKTILHDKSGYLRQNIAPTASKERVDNATVYFTYAPNTLVDGADAATISRSALKNYAKAAVGGQADAIKYFKELSIDPNKIVDDFSKGKSVVIIAVNEKLNSEDPVIVKNRNVSIAHELIIHAKNRLNGIEKSSVQEHKEAYDLEGSKSFYSNYDIQMIEQNYSPQKGAPGSTIQKIDEAVEKSN